MYKMVSMSKLVEMMAVTICLHAHQEDLVIIPPTHTHHHKYPKIQFVTAHQ